MYKVEVAKFSLPFESKRQKTIGLRPFLLGAVLRLRSSVALPVSTATFVAVRWSPLSRLACRCTEHTSLAHAAQLPCAAERHRLAACPSSRDPRLKPAPGSRFRRTTHLSSMYLILNGYCPPFKRLRRTFKKNACKQLKSGN